MEYVPKNEVTERKNNERRLYDRIIKRANENGWALYRIEDAGNNKKPFDIGGCSSSGKGVALEVKISESSNVAFEPPLSMLSFHQNQWLKAYADKDGLSLFVIYYPQLRQWTFFQLVKKVFMLVCFEEESGLKNWTLQFENLKNTE